MTSFSPVVEMQSFRRRLEVTPSGGLVAGRCQRCWALVWPTPSRCMRCGSADMVGEWLWRSGTVETWTRVWVGIGVLKPPYVIARVRFGDCAIYGRVEGVADVDVGTAVHLEARHAIGGDIEYWFELPEPEPVASTWEAL